MNSETPNSILADRQDRRACSKVSPVRFSPQRMTQCLHQPPYQYACFPELRRGHPHAQRSIVCYMVVALLGLSLVGCSSKGELEPVPVAGTISHNNQPLTHGSVAFIPTDRTKGRSARATISEGGTFELTTFDANDGALPGNYKVTVFCFDGTRDVPGSRLSKPGPSLIPERYNTADTTDLTATVGEKRTQVTLELHD